MAMSDDVARVAWALEQLSAGGSWGNLARVIPFFPPEVPSCEDVVLAMMGVLVELARLQALERRVRELVALGGKGPIGGVWVGCIRRALEGEADAQASSG